MNWDTLCNEARARALTVLGGVHLEPDDGGPEGARTLVLLGPDPTGFWPALQASPEAHGPDPVDRWSAAVIGAWADKIGAMALFPFGEPRQPFFTWALKCPDLWQSPVGMLVHREQGLMVSFRGALAFSERLPLPAPKPNPCETCAEQPCRTACPVGALGAAYDIQACRDHLATPDNACMARGCAARRACPHSPARPDAQSAHHMSYFLP